MNKTRMGKRVASLLLSLVMMLSLLPTAAYAAMGDADETQGASVSENGTRVSDDSNSGGDTGDLQVGDSSGSGTEDDTTGAEGGNDTTGAEGGADPTGSVNATTTYVAYIGEVGYETLDAAITAAGDGETVVVSEGEYTLNGSLTYTDKAITVKAADGAKVTFDMSKAVALHGAKITFENVTFNYTNADYTGLQHTDTVVYNNCTINGKMFLYANSETFNDCHFVQKSEDYNVWTYGAKKVAFNNCTFDCVGKAVNVYIEKGNASDDAKTVEVNGCTVNSDKAGKAFLNIKNSTQAYDVTLSGTNTVTGLAADGTTGSALYQVEATKVTETTGKTVSVKEKADDGTVKTVYEVKQPSANVAKVGSTEYATLADAIAALSGSSYTLELLDETAWNVATPVYWAAGTQSGFVATLADALTAAYKANVGAITIVCRPGADVGKLTHGHVADNITIYGNNAYISSGECELEVDTFMYSRETGKQVTTGGAYLDKDITVTAYELDNLGVWGERHTDHKVTVNLTDCDTVNGITVQRVYISGTTGVNDITLTGCDFGTKATSVYSNADGAVVIDNCSFTGAQVPVNFNHKAGGTQTVTVRNSKFTNCGDNDAWKQFAAPVRFVNSGSGTMTTSVDTCTFTGTVGGNGDILLGDGREGQKSNDVTLTVKNTAANVQAQQPGYYGDGGTKDESKLGEKTVAAGETLTTSVNELVSDVAYVAAVGEKKFESLQAAIDAAGRNATVRLLADTRENVTISTNYLTLDLNGHTLNGGTEKGKPALTVTARVTVKDSSAAKTGTIMREDTAENSGVSSHYVIDIQDGWLFFESGNVTNNSGNDSGKGASLVRVGDDSIAKYPGLTISGGTFTQDNFIVIKVDRGTFYLKEDGTLNSKNSYAVENWKFAEIKGGTVNGTVAAWTYSGGHNSDLTISGGTVNGNVASVSYDKTEGKVAKVSITGGTVNGTLGTYTYGNGLIPIADPTKATIAVTGGTFSKDPTKYVVEDSAINKNDDGTYGVAKAYLAKVGDTSYYTMDEAFKAQTASGKDIVLLRDYTTGSTFNSGTVKRTVDLNGHTWTCTGTDANSAAFEINNPNATLTVKNGKVVSSQLVGLIPSAMGGTIKYDNSELVFENVVMTTTARSGIETNGNNTNDTVTLKNSTLNVPNGFGIYFPSSGTLTIDNSKINAKTMGVQVCSGSLNITGADTAITVSGDGIEKTGNDGAIEDGAAISIVERTGYKGLSEIKVEGGTFTAKAGNDAVKAYKWENQTASAFDNSKNVVAVSGGTFSSAVDKSLCADGFIPTDNGNGTYGVKEGKYVAEIGSQGYESLQEAINAAQDGDTVTLLADATEDVVISKSITLDLGGKTLTNTNAGKATISVTGGTVTVKNGNVVGGTDYYNIEAKKDANLTLTDVTATAGNNGSSMIDNYGTLTITSGTYTGGLNVVKSEEGSKLTITGGTFTGNYATNGYTGVILVYGDTTISGGEFIQSLTTTGRWNHPQVIATGVVEGYTAITRVTGGHFVNKMSGESIFRGIGKATSDNFEVSGGTFNKSISDGYFKEGYFAKKTNNGYEADGPYAVRIGTTAGYATLGAAIEAINSGATTSTTITLLQDLTESVVISKNTTIDLNGKTLTNNGAANTIQVNGGKLTVKDSSAKKLAVDSNTKTVTYTSGKIVNNQPRSAQCVAVKVNAGASFVLTSGTLESQHNYALNVTGENANATVNGGYIVGPEGAIGVFDKAQLTVKNGVMLGTDNAAIAGNGNAGNGDTTITISGGTIIGRIESAGYIACGIYHPQSGTLKISGGTIYAVNGVGILMRAGVLNMTGGKIVSSGNVSGRVGDANVITTCYGVYVDGSANYSGAKDAEFGAKISGTASITADAGVSVLNLSNSNATNGTIGVSGGTFTTEIPAAYCADGFIPTQNEDGTYGVKVGQYVAEVGSTKYETLAEAVAAAQDGQTVRLLADVALDAQIATGKAITIDGQSKYTIKAAKKLESADGKAGMFYRTQSAKGTLTFLNVTLDGNGASKIFLNEGGAGETVFDGVTSTNGGGIAYGSGIHISGGGSHATIRNSTLTGSTGRMELNNANYYAANDLWVGGNVYVTVENSVIGNVFVNSAPSATATNGVVHGQLTITGEKTKITYLSGEEEAADKLDKFGNNGSLVKIDSGYVEKVFDKGSYAISGGTFKTEVKKEWCAAGYVPTQNADGTYGVEVGKFTVQVTSRTTGSNSPVANVTGGGSNITYAQGTTVTASAISGYKFVGWFVNEYTGTPYSTDLTCEVKPTDDCTMIAVYEPISGGVFALEVSASKFTVNGGATQRSYLLEKMPVGTQVTVVFKGSENFLYWVNESGKVVSTSKTYTFSMGSATTLKAVYAEKEENQAMVVFISHTQQVISSKGYTDTQEIQFPEPPIKMGATFVRWSMTEAEIRAAMATTTTGIIVVEPVYEFSAGSYTVTVNYPNDETATYTATVGKITTVTAKSIDGKVFKCWKNGDTVLGYTETLKIAPRGDLTLTAEYVDAGTTVDRLPVIALTEISASQQGAKYAVSFTATRSVPEGYTVTEQGILVSTNSQYGEADALDAMKLDANGNRPDNTLILKDSNTDAMGVTVLNGTTKYADRTVYGRAYMILRDSSGTMVYVYSDTILSGSYNSLTTNGGN